MASFLQNEVVGSEARVFWSTRALRILQEKEEKV
jgi:hypothetical protein